MLSTFVSLSLFVISQSPRGASPPSRPPVRSGPYKVATDFPSLQAAIDSFTGDRGGTLFLPAGTYRITKPLSFRGRHYGLDLVGEGQSRIVAGFDAPDLPMIDLTGSSFCTLRNLTIETEGQREASCGLLVARVGSQYSSGAHYFECISVSGRFREGAVICLASETNTWVRCNFMNFLPGGRAFAMLSHAGRTATRAPRDDGRKPADAAAPFAPELFALPAAYPPCEGGSMLETSFYDCLWTVGAETGREVNFWIETDRNVAGDINIFGGGMKSISSDYANPSKGTRAGILMLMRSGGLNTINIVGCRFETDGAKHCIEAWTAPGGSIGNVGITGCTLLAREEIVRVSGNGVSGWAMSRNFLANQAGYAWGESGRRALIRFSRLFYSDIDATNLTFADGRPSAKLGMANLAIAVDLDAQGNTFTVADRGLIAMGSGDNRGNVIRTTAEDGYARQRQYLGAESILNLTPTKCESVKSARVGDVILDPERGLVWFDGKDWRK